MERGSGMVENIALPTRCWHRPSGVWRTARQRVVTVKLAFLRILLLGDFPKLIIRKECKEMCRTLITTTLFIIDEIDKLINYVIFIQ